MTSGHPKGQKPKNPLFMELRHPGMTYCKSYIRSIVVIYSSIPFFYEIAIFISYLMIEVAVNLQNILSEQNEDCFTVV